MMISTARKSANVDDLVLATAKVLDAYMASGRKPKAGSDDWGHFAELKHILREDVACEWSAITGLEKFKFPWDADYVSSIWVSWRKDAKNRERNIEDIEKRKATNGVFVQSDISALDIAREEAEQVMDQLVELLDRAEAMHESFGTLIESSKIVDNARCIKRKLQDMIAAVN